MRAQPLPPSAPPPGPGPAPPAANCPSMSGKGCAACIATYDTRKNWASPVRNLQPRGTINCLHSSIECV